ncbi:hypothetical protein ILYODFUR_028113 [Ilyodon furcidens]|uniref:Uncharacterized protein n=1 Tax=Ilyodon furcidens TaxID=33524 RepID=A0ABV0UW33_9TELE
MLQPSRPRRRFCRQEEEDEEEEGFTDISTAALHSNERAASVQDHFPPNRSGFALRAAGAALADSWRTAASAKEIGAKRGVRAGLAVTLRRVLGGADWRSFSWLNVTD